MAQSINYDVNDFDEELNIDLKKIIAILLNRKFLILSVFIGVFIFFILLTYILPKKYIVDADLYINKSNNSNMMEINPYVIEELGAADGMAALMSGSGNLSNEIELIKSPLVMDNVIRENNIVYKKRFGFLPNKKEGEYLSTEDFLKKNIDIDNEKGTNVVNIEYKNKDKDLAYGVVNSIINNYEKLHKQINSEKAKADLKIIEDEYNNAKDDLKRNMNNVSGIPQTAMASAGNLTAMSAFSKSAQSALSNIKGEYIAGEKSQIAIQEDVAKVTQLTTKLEWAKLVNEMSDSSKVIVLKAPKQLRDFEYASPRLFTNIFLGIIFGVIASFFTVLFKEYTDKKLTYSMIGNNVIYDTKIGFNKLKIMLLNNDAKTLGFITFEDIPNDFKNSLKSIDCTNFVKAEISKEFKNLINNYSAIILFEKINKTKTEDYKLVKEMLISSNKNVLSEVLL